MLVTRVVNSVFHSNTYILSDDTVNYIYLVDIGDIQSVISYLISGIEIRGVFLTHSHYDHLYGLNKLSALFPDCIVYTSADGKEGLYSEKLNFSKYHNDPFVYAGNKIQLLKEGDEIEIFPKEKLRIIETPGHDPGCLTYYTDKYIFTGDSYIPALKIVTTFPRSNKEQAKISFQKIRSISCQYRIVCPGHGAME